MKAKTHVFEGAAIRMVATFVKVKTAFLCFKLKIFKSEYAKMIIGYLASCLAQKIY
jgi:hypothetical protein